MGGRDVCTSDGVVHSYLTIGKQLKQHQMEITIRHQSENTLHVFNVVDPNNLTSAEVKAICAEMNVQAIFVNGIYYEDG